ncbi:hypothetical protein MKQ70_36300 [Chitinophaga sedimenti]|uniref:hypothetical protein n=1 Tax=Chitinophaga sedimenti TaxID=2033606 RepID=UPI002005F5B8|nr:hypothetical protein [Chitinophaga sedimenti]MCK7560090.1 hypothetical protein [Chitinophaga sedimenti]
MRALSSFSPDAETFDRGVDTQAQVGIVAQVDGVKENETEVYQEQVVIVDLFQEGVAEQAVTRNNGDKRQRDHDDQGQAQIELQPEIPGFGDGGGAVKRGFKEKEVKNYPE